MAAHIITLDPLPIVAMLALQAIAESIVNIIRAPIVIFVKGSPLSVSSHALLT